MPVLAPTMTTVFPARSACSGGGRRVHWLDTTPDTLKRIAVVVVVVVLVGIGMGSGSHVVLALRVYVPGENCHSIRESSPA